ncbi:hypothetical protein [Streptomyces aidingensis]|uniref:Uncharacterized protein n=1 Tax=Streptomyces aidingensis TaxID=910347 RepID=A0A1I1HD16_9ACTN|nr:hypothetical protein [Streptomyces aidingensis]SFC22049.1 hypothetical protein SAMN05421773_102348 [Streptomyces aidingensis]
MTTDHACQTAAGEAARGIDPVRAVLAPGRPRTRASAVPVVIRAYLDSDSADGPDGTSRQEDMLPPDPATPAMGAAMLLTMLDGLQADLSGALLSWYAELPVRVPHGLGAPSPSAPGVEPPREPNEWQVLGTLRGSAQELLTALSQRPRAEGFNELSWRLAMLEDVFAGALRRMNVPAEISVRAAADVAQAAGSLFGLGRPAKQRG